MTVPLPITPTDALALVQVRSLLDAARIASDRVAPATRLIATVLLDAVNEHAMHLVATSLGVSISNSENFDGLKSKVQQELGSAWSSVNTSWRDVRKLHLARNLAQHSGIGADREEIAGWRAATEQFTNSLIECAFGQQVDRISLSSTIRDDELRGLLIQAEDLLEAGQVAASVRQIFTAFTRASNRWESQNRGRGRMRPSKPSVFDLADRKAFEYLEDLAARASDVALNQVFSASPGEYQWFASIYRERPESLDEVEARRALSFVFWWIVEWEATAPAFVDDRRRRQERARRRTRQSDTSARITGINSVSEIVFHSARSAGASEEEPRTQWRVGLSIADVPPELTFEVWRTELRRVLSALPAVQYAVVDEAGDVELTLDLAPNDDRVTSIAEGVASALESVEERVHALERSEREARDVEIAKVESYAAAVGALRERIPSWVAEIALDPGAGFGGDTGLVVTFTDQTLMMPAANALRDVAGITQAVPGRHGLLIVPALEPERLIDALTEVSPTVLAKAEEADTARREYSSRVERVAGEFRRIIRRVPTDDQAR